MLQLDWIYSAFSVVTVAMHSKLRLLQIGINFQREKIHDNETAEAEETGRQKKQRPGPSVQYQTYSKLLEAFRPIVEKWKHR